MKELVDLVVKHVESRRRFKPRRASVDVDNAGELGQYMRLIVRGEDEVPSRDTWLSQYEMDIVRPNSEQVMFTFVARGEDEDPI